MRIVIDARIISSTTGTYILNLLKNLDTLDSPHDYIVLVPAKDLSYWTPMHKNFTLQACDIKNYSFTEQTLFLRQLLALKADLVHFCMPQQPILYFKKHVTTVHDLTLLQTYNSDKNWFVFHAKQLVGRFVFRMVGKLSDHILTPTQFTKKAFADYAHLSESKLTVTYEAADKLPKIVASEPALPNKNYILYVGQQSDYKNIKRLMQAHQTLLISHPELELVLVGSLNESAKKNQQWAKQQQFKHIHFTGYVTNEELAWLYEHCQAYIFPSLMEGFGLPGLEAMLYGAPVVSSDATCLPEVYGDAAHYFDPTLVSDMAKKIQHVLENSELRAELIKKGYKRTKDFSWSRMAQQTHNVYENVLKNK